MTERMSAAAYRATLAGSSPRKTAKRSRPRHKEATEQAAVVAWARLRHAEAPDLWPDLDSLFCSLAGVVMTEAQAGRAKAQGNRPGVFDLILLVPLNGYHGLLVEMKADEGRPSKEQLEERARLTRLGYCCAICYGREQAVQVIREYYGR